jgi:Kef-type K+ transport system membrane component KefB
MLNAGGDDALKQLLLAALALPVLAGLTYLAVKFVIIKLITTFDRFHEYIFLVAIGWCLGVAEVAKLIGLSHEIGAFIAGISLATSPIAQYIALSLKPLRDFFLVLFFFTLGARFDISLLSTIIVPAIVLAGIVLALKPVIYFVLLRGFSEKKDLAWDIGFRLGQISEFSLLIAYLAQSKAMISTQASLLIQATAIITFVISSYIVIFNYPTPIAVSDELRRD